MYNSNLIWLGTRDSYESVINMQKAVSDGSLLKLMADNDKLTAQGYMEEEDYRIGSELLQVVENVAIITASGSLVSSHNWYNSFFGVVSYEQIRDAIDLAANDESITRIVLHIESPGGTVIGLDDLGEYIYYISNNVKSIYGHTTSHAHSAGFWVLCSTKNITASKTASVGSVGVIMTLVSQKKYLDEIGIEFTYIRSGKFKALGQVGEELSEEALAEFTGMVTELHEFFMSQVIRGRGSLASQNVGVWNEGRTFLAGKAKDIGLVDDIATLDNIVAKMVKTVDNRFMVDSNVTSETNKGAIMNLKSLNKEQQAKLASGVPLDKLGLSDEDLAKAQAELEQLNAEANEAEEGKSIKADAEEGTNAAKADDSSNGISDEDASTASEGGNIAEVLKLNTALTKENAKLEIKLEQLNENLAGKEAHITTLESNEKELLTIAGEAINKFQVAVGAQATSLDGLDAKAILTQYAEAKNKFEATFKIGATSKQTSGSRETQESLKPLNPIKKLVKE